MRDSRTTVLVAVAGFAMLVSASPAAAQNLGLAYPYPTTDMPVTVSPGTVVHVRSLVIFRGHNGSGLTLVLQSPSPSTDTSRLAQQTREVVEHYAAFAKSNAVDRVSVEVCRTQACLELREQSTERFEFVWAEGRGWTRAAAHGR